MHALAPMGVAMAERPSSRDADFSSYMHARQASLLRTAYQLTGDRHTAEDLVRDRRWGSTTRPRAAGWPS